MILVAMDRRISQSQETRQTDEIGNRVPSDDRPKPAPKTTPSMSAAFLILSSCDNGI